MPAPTSSTRQPDSVESVGRSRGPGGRGRDDFATRIEHPAAADRRQREGERKIGPEDARPEIDFRNGDGVLWPEQHVVENSTVLAERDLAIGAAVDVVEGDTRQTPLCQATEIRNIDDVRRVDSIGHSRVRNDCRLYSSRRAAEVLRLSLGRATNNVLALTKQSDRMTESSSRRWWPARNYAEFRAFGPAPAFA